MKQFYMQFRIGEKIALSFGLVGLLFLTVIWQYQRTLQSSLADYETLHTVFVAKKGHALLIENQMLAAGNADKEFLLHRSEEYLAQVTKSLNGVLAQAEVLAQIDARGSEAAARIAGLVQTYRQRFAAIAQAWHIKGLDHNSGLQGAFRDAAHRLEARAENFKVGGLYLQLLRIRRAEKDLALTREAEYRDRVTTRTGAFEAWINNSGLDTELKQALLREVGVYRETFLAYAEALLGGDAQADSFAFDQAAHRIEGLLDRHYIPDLGLHLLQLRRREKDYLLRGDDEYVDMALQELDQISEQLEQCDVSDTDKGEVDGLLNDYRRNFLALVEQNRKIDRLHREMRSTVAEVANLVRKNVREAERAMQQSAERIHASSEDNSRFMLWVAGLATLLGILSAVIITLSIIGPLRRIAGVLDQLAYEEPVDRVAAIPGGRDEVNIMAQLVNTIADHKARFLDWWKVSMREAQACKNVAARPDSPEARDKFEKIQRDKQTLAGELREELHTLIKTVCEYAQRLKLEHPRGKRLQDTLEMEKAAKSALSILEVMRGSRCRDS